MTEDRTFLHFLHFHLYTSNIKTNDSISIFLFYKRRLQTVLIVNS